MAAGDGLIIMRPTSIAYAGTTAGINADGGVDFTAVTSLSLNGVFTSSFDNYLIVVRNTLTTAADTNMRLRAAGTDASGSNYTYQFVIANNTSITGGRATTTNFIFGGSSTNNGGEHIHMYGPNLAQPTAARNVSANGNGGGYIQDIANTHSLSTAYDGFTYFVNSGTITGNVAVFGYEE